MNPDNETDDYSGYLDDYFEDLDPNHPMDFMSSQADFQRLADSYSVEYINEFDNSSPSPPERPGLYGNLDHQRSSYYRGPIDTEHYRCEEDRQSSQSFLYNTQQDPPNTPHLSDGHRSTYSERGSEVSRAIHGQPGLEHSSFPTYHDIRLRPVTDLPDVYRGIFRFGVFNKVQSICFNDIFGSDKNLIVSAPTGSGKTVLFELAIIRLFTGAKITGESLKCVYMAPTKALCSEKYNDWAGKFGPLGLKCCELTGDTTSFGASVWGDAKDASIIVTTSEKWDSLTRNWRNHDKILSQVKLFLVDEVHILNESRGSTLEVVISRMKTRGKSIRFIVVSATVPNIQDVASWIGNISDPGMPAGVYEFGEEFRPCKLVRHVIGVHRQKNQNDFMFAKILDYRLFSVLQQYSVGKPILVFCSTRKGVFGTAEHLMKDYIENESKKQTLPWSRPPRIDHAFYDKRLTEFASFGIGVHHAGLTMDDRKATEDLYLRKILRILIATSTLAVGVNLPAHVVVIKGVRGFQNNVSVEYSDLDIMQMLGRAGRPQFDKEGVAIIICEDSLESKYKALAQGKTVLESSLHKNISEHLNSEIGLGTITSVESAKEWLRGSFFFQRIRKNPNYYALHKEDNQTWQERIDDVVAQSVENLKQSQLIKDGDTLGDLQSTEFGDIMSRFYIKLSTMKKILNISRQTTLRGLLETVSSAEEVCDTKMRASEKFIYNNLRRHPDIRFEIKKVEKVSDKVFLLIQAVLGGISLNAAEFKSTDNQPHLEAFNIFKHVSRIAKAIVEVAIVEKRGAQVKYGLELVRCLISKAWEDRPVVLRQIEQIGEKSLKVLAEHGITSLSILRSQNPLRIETVRVVPLILNRRPPFGLDVLSSVNELPQYKLEIIEIGMNSFGGKSAVEANLKIECSLIINSPSPNSKSKKYKFRGANVSSIITLNSDMDLIDFRRIPTKAFRDKKTFEIFVEFTKPSQSITVIVTSEVYAGVSTQKLYKPSVPVEEFPVLDTRPIPFAETDLAGLEDDPEFWNVSLSDGDTTLGKSSNQDTTKRQDTLTGTKKRNTDYTISGAKQLPNGRYECNHACKDKTKCRHLCCRDGLPEPPLPSKKHTSVTFEKNENADPMKSQPPLIGSKPIPLRPKNQTKRLDDYHNRTEITKNLGLSAEQRIKLNISNKSKIKRRTKRDFDINFTDLQDPEDKALFISDLVDIDDIDDLPQNITVTRERVGIMTDVASSSGYSNSEVDALICALPAEICDGDLMHGTTQLRAPAQNAFGKSPLKRSLAIGDDTSNKRLKQNAQVTQISSGVYKDSDIAPAENEHSSYVKTRIDYDEFALDYDYIDVLASDATKTTIFNEDN